MMGSDDRMIGWVGGVGCRPFFGEILLLRFHPVHGCFIVTSPYGHPGPRAGGREGRGGKDERGLTFSVLLAFDWDKELLSITTFSVPTPRVEDHAYRSSAERVGF